MMSNPDVMLGVETKKNDTQANNYYGTLLNGFYYGNGKV